MAGLGHQFGPNTPAFLMKSTDNAIMRLNKIDKLYLLIFILNQEKNTKRSVSSLAFCQ